jgi:ABC-type uncharacterized transport system permease subunit
MLQVAIIIKALAEVAGFALIGQGALYLLAGANRDKNGAYQILKTVTSPILKFARIITPRFVLDQHVGLVAFFLVFVIWYFAGQQKLHLCLTQYPDHPSCVAMIKTLEERRGGTQR